MIFSNIVSVINIIFREGIEGDSLSVFSQLLAGHDVSVIGR